MSSEREIHDLDTFNSHHDASRWAGELRDAAIAGRRNLIVDTTLGHADGAIQTIKELQAKGYNVEVRAVATHRQERKHEQAVYQHP